MLRLKLIAILLLTGMLSLSIPSPAQALLVPGYGDVEAFGFDRDSLMDYYLYLQATDLPDGFVSPLEFHPIGTFYQWIDLTDRNQPDNTEYYYGVDLHDEDTTLWFHIQHGKKHTFSYMELGMEYVGEDMTTLSDSAPVESSTRSIIHRGDLIFYYSAKKLISIFWNTQHAAFEIGPYSYSYEDSFTYTPGSFMEKLFSLDDEKFQKAQDVLISMGTGKYIASYMPNPKPVEAPMKTISLPGEGKLNAPGFDDLAEYRNYLKIAELPDGFVKPSEFHPIGTFYQWVKISESNREDNFDYLYGIQLDNDDTTLWFRVKHNAGLDLRNIPVLDISSVNNDMRTISETVDAETRALCIIPRGKLTYLYVNGALFSLHWQREDTDAKISVLFNIYFTHAYSDEITYTTDSFMEKLLSLDEEKFQDARDVLISLGTGKYDNYEDAPPSTEPTEPTEPTAPATSTETQTSTHPATQPVNPTLTNDASSGVVITVLVISTVVGSIITIVVLRKNARGR